MRAYRPDALVIGLSVFIAVMAVGAFIRMLLRRRPNAMEVERRRREAINRRGKISDGEITEVFGGSIVYSYSVAGVEYTATQDLTTLRDQVAGEWTSIVGPVCLKYDPRNPANSIVVCESWSGLRQDSAASRPQLPR